MGPRLRGDDWETCLCETSKLPVESSRENRHRAAVGVVGGGGDELVVGGQRDLLVQRVGVIGLEDALAPVVERAIADQDAETAGGDEVAVISRQRVDRAA